MTYNHNIEETRLKSVLKKDNKERTYRDKFFNFISKIFIYGLLFLIAYGIFYFYRMILR
jgi:hypothetical protein